MTTDPGTCERPAVKTDATVSATYAKLREGQFGRTIDAAEGVMVDIDPDGCVLGIEVLDGSAWQDALVSLAMAGRLRVPPSQSPGFMKDVSEQRISGGRVRLIHIPTGVSAEGPTRDEAMPVLGAELLKRGDITVNDARAAHGLKPFEDLR